MSTLLTAPAAPISAANEWPNCAGFGPIPVGFDGQRTGEAAVETMGSYAGEPASVWIDGVDSGQPLTLEQAEALAELLQDAVRAARAADAAS